MKVSTVASLVSLIAAPWVYAQPSFDVRGSGTVYPFATQVAELLTRRYPRMTPPKIERNGTGRGLKDLCDASLPASQRPLVANASRRIEVSELSQCLKIGDGSIIEIPFGQDGIVLGSARSSLLSLDLRALFLALAARTPTPSTKTWEANTRTTWGQVFSDLTTFFPQEKAKWKKEAQTFKASQRIIFYGPQEGSGTRDAFKELALEKGCHGFQAPPNKAFCTTLREDSAYRSIGASDDYRVSVQKVTSNKEALAIFPYSFLADNPDSVHPLTINGVAPTFQAIKNRTYPLARVLRFYVNASNMDRQKKTRLIQLYVETFLKAAQSGQELEDRGLVPLSAQGSAACLRRLTQRVAITRSALRGNKELMCSG